MLPLKNNSFPATAGSTWPFAVELFAHAQKKVATVVTTFLMLI